ncbi:hypothetical protein [Sedimentibacter sp. B4]|uniref:hypothetical protein n=1 Tax=Sedimentibacter sp. B4 TaxID=304766 RepID=UPI00031C1F08|nr:hypothetical protein [Sedimentibacter sp. B4]
MGDIQVIFEVPEWVEKGLNNGDYRIFGGVIRNAKGQIVHHLKNGIWESSKDDIKNAAEAIKNAPGKTKVIAIVGVGCVALSVLGYASYKIIKDKKSLKKLNKFNDTLKNYITDGISGTLSADKIIEFTASCNELIEVLNRINISEIEVNEFNNQQFSELINSVRGYTDKLNKAYKTNKIVPERSNGNTIKSNIIDLRKYLEIQSEIYSISL